MLVNGFTSPLIADSGAIAGWTITALLTFLLIGLPTLYLLVLILAGDDNGFDRSVRNIEQYVKLSQRAHAYASSKDVYNVLEEQLVLAPLAATAALSASVPAKAPSTSVTPASRHDGLDPHRPPGQQARAGIGSHAEAEAER